MTMKNVFNTHLISSKKNPKQSKPKHYFGFKLTNNTECLSWIFFNCRNCY